MTIQRLSKLADWRVKHKEQDVRGLDLWEREGARVGTIADMVVDTDARLVTSVVLEDGRHVAAEDIDIEGSKVYLDVPLGEEFEGAERRPQG